MLNKANFTYAAYPQQFYLENGEYYYILERDAYIKYDGNGNLFRTHNQH